VAVLIELPVAGSSTEAAALDDLAAERGALLVGAQTSRWLPAVRRIRAAIRAGRPGPAHRVRIERHVAPRERSWTDDPLLHHGQHAIDTLRLWFGELSIDAARRRDAGRSVTFRGHSSAGASFEVSVAHAAASDVQRIEVHGRDGMLSSDGFGRIEGSGAASGIALDINPAEAYLAAIAAQDRSVIAGVRNGAPGTRFADTLANLRVVEAIRGYLA
jgi:predicted dehydrogenase